MLKIMLFALHYTKLFQILLDYASHQKCMPIYQPSRPEQVPVLQKSISKGIQTLSWYRCKPYSITEGEKKGRVSQAHAMIRSRASF